MNQFAHVLRYCAVAVMVFWLAAGSAQAVIHQISVGSNFFSPLKTQASPGDTVRWVRQSGFHTTTSIAGSPLQWDSGTLQAGVPFDLVIPAGIPGPYPYQCDFHPLSMKDTIFVTSLSVQFDQTDGLPRAFALEQNFPNPFNPTTSVRFSIERNAEVEFTIFNAIGQVVERHDFGQLRPGSYSVEWNAGTKPSGIYFYRLQADQLTQTRKMVLIK